MGEGGLPCSWKMELFRDLKSMLLHERRIYIMGIARHWKVSDRLSLELWK